MTITSETIYWLTRLDYIQGLFIGFSCLSGFAVLMLCIACHSVWECTYKEEEYKLFWRLVRYTVIMFCVMCTCIFGVVFTPNTNEMCMIYVVPKIVNSDFVQEDLPKDAREIYDLAKQAVVKQLTGEEKK